MEETKPRCRCNGSAATHYITARAINGRIRLCDSLFIAMFGLTDSPLLSLSKPLHGPYSTLYYQTSSNIRTSVIEQPCLPWSKIPFQFEHCGPPKWKEIMYRNRYISVWYFAVSEQNRGFCFFFAECMKLLCLRTSLKYARCIKRTRSTRLIKLRENEKRPNIPSYVEPKDNNSITSTKKKRYNYCNLWQKAGRAGLS